jgi:MoaA/NifB/PqqE/SkfB family radical SAM enzyme
MCKIWEKPTEDELTCTEIADIFKHAPRFSWINLSGGEIFMRRDIHDIILSVIRESPHLYLLNFPTNGLRTRDIIETVDVILATTRLPRLVVTVSLDGPRAVHEQIRGVPGMFDSALATFRALRDRRSRRFSVFFGYTLQVANLASFDDTLRDVQAALGNCSVDDFHMNVAHVSGHYYGNTRFEGIPDGRAAGEVMQRITRARTAHPLHPVAVLERRYQGLAATYLTTGRIPLVCQAASASCFIDPAGTVYPCIGLAAPIGALRQNGYDLYRLWRSESRLRIRHAAKTGACDGCWTPCEAYQTLLANLLPAPRRRA